MIDAVGAGLPALAEALKREQARAYQSGGYIPVAREYLAAIHAPHTR